MSMHRITPLLNVFWDALLLRYLQSLRISRLSPETSCWDKPYAALALSAESITSKNYFLTLHQAFVPMIECNREQEQLPMGDVEQLLRGMSDTSSRIDR